MGCAVVTAAKGTCVNPGTNDEALSGEQRLISLSVDLPECNALTSPCSILLRAGDGAACIALAL
jgi:hypothetical protein